MKTRLSLLVAGCVAVAAVVMVADLSVRSLFADNPQGSGNQGQGNWKPGEKGIDMNVHVGMGQKLTLPAGCEVKDLGQESNIKAQLGATTNDAITKNTFKRIVGTLATPERDRITNEMNNANLDFAKLDGRIDQIQKAWKAKYGNDFDITKQPTVFSDKFEVVQGNIVDTAQAAAGFPIDPVANWSGRATEGAAVLAGAQLNQVLDKGHSVAAVRFPTESRLPELTVSMLREGNDWKYFIPAGTSAQKLYDQILNHLTYVGDHLDKMPGDANEAYRHVAHHVFMALYGVDLPRGNDMDKTKG